MSKAGRVLTGVGVTLAAVFVLAGALFANAVLRPVDALRPGDVRGPALSASSDTGPPHGGRAPEPSHGDDAPMKFSAPNLTSHPTGMVGRLTEDAFVSRMRGGRVYRSSIMPWESFARSTDVALRSVYRYLRTIPPVARDVGPTYRTGGWQPPG